MPQGVIINCITIFIGGLLGAFLKNYFPKKLTEALPNICGLSAITMGVYLIIRLQSLAAVILAVIVGTVLGELLGLEENLMTGLKKLEKKLPVNLEEEQMEVIISLIILFCFSGTGIFGTTAGFLVGFIAIPQFAVGILLFCGATYILPFTSDLMISNFKACGGIITLAVGLKISNIKKTRVLNILPALILVFPFSLLL